MMALPGPGTSGLRTSNPGRVHCPLPPPLPRPAPPLLGVEVVPVGVVLVAGVVVEVVEVVGMVGVVGVVVDEVGAGVEVVLVAVLVAVLVLLVLLLVVLVGVVLVVALGWLGVAVVAGSWQSWAASRPTVLAPWSRLRRNVGPTEGGSSATRLLKLVIAVRASVAVAGIDRRGDGGRVARSGSRTRHR